VRFLLRDDQDDLLRWVLTQLQGDASDAPVPNMPGERFREAGLWSGLTALIATVAKERAVDLPSDWQLFAEEQRREVARRQERFAALLPRVLAALHEADVRAIPVKGAVFMAGDWVHASARPMADLDILVDPAQRSVASVALRRIGLEQVGGNAWEDTFLGWGDGSIGRVDGESADHNGKVELHPGWVERLHHYLVDDGSLVTSAAARDTLAGVSCWLLPPAAFAVHVVGHLSACVIRGDARAVNVLDSVLALRALDGDGRRAYASLIEQLDPRLSAPGLWLVHAHQPDAIAETTVTAALQRLPPAAQRRLAMTSTSAVLRGIGGRTDLGWRLAFTRTHVERLRVIRQAIVPPVEDQRPGQKTGGLRFHASRVGRRVLRARTG
jgi:Uncharacterised nucleotidyltransferase